MNKHELWVIGKRFIRTKIFPLFYPNLNQTAQRSFFVGICFAIGFCIVAIKAYNVVSSKYDDFAVDKLHYNSSSFHRKNIVDRNGQVLAVDLAISSIYANPKKILDAKEAVKKLKEVFPGLNSQTLYKDLTSKKKSFVWIKRNATPKEVYAVNKLGLPGVMYENGHRRFYPHNNLLSHIIGYVGIDGMGLAGIEKNFDKQLIIDEGIDSNDSLALSIDLRIQFIVYEELKAAFDEFKPIGAAAIVADVSNGEILSIVSLPDFNPHNPGKASSEQLFNRATHASQELGSVFKIVTMAMGIDNKTVNLASSYDVSEPIKYARFKLKDYHAKGGVQTIPQIFLNSSNIGTAKIAMDLGIDIQKKYLKKFGLFDPVSIEIPEKGQALYPSSSKWGALSTMTISYGHGMMLTPIHFMRSFIGILNDGKMFELTLLLDGNKGKISTKIIATDTADKIKKLLRLVVKEGTGKKAEAMGYIVGGKTVSAEKSIKGGYSKKANISSFVAAFPIHEPKYALFVILDEPKGNAATFGYATGGWTAAPVISKIITRMSAVLGIEPIDEEDKNISKKLYIDRSLYDNKESF